MADTIKPTSARETESESSMGGTTGDGEATEPDEESTAPPCTNAIDCAAAIAAAGNMCALVNATDGLDATGLIVDDVFDGGDGSDSDVGSGRGVSDSAFDACALD